MNLFAYGTLIEPRVLHRVTGLTPGYTSGTLVGFRRLAFENESFPGIVSTTTQDAVKGRIFYTLSQQAWPRLDAFESEIYRRIEVEVLASTNEIIRAETYVVKDAYQHLLADRDWDFDHFLSHHLDQYLNED
jgi:gamma-glutamylcyclotransferase (GGCT)/AIG2-like uncharacterized protein YtfP